MIAEIVKKPFDQSSLAKLSPIEPFTPACEFLKERRLVGTSLQYSHENDAIAIVIHGSDGLPTGIKYRKIDPEANPRYLSEAGSVNEGYWIIGTDKSKLLIVEGEIDAITAAIAGFKGTILACQTNRISDNALTHVKAFKNVFMIPDKDLGGLELKDSIERLLGPFKAKFIDLNQAFYGDARDEGLFGPSGVKDLNELLMKGGHDVCSEFIRISTQTELERDTRSFSQSIPELLTYLSDERNTRGDSTGWKALDKTLGGGLRASEMSVINAFAKTGKSSFINNIIHNLAKSGKKIGLASFEMPPHSVYTTLISIAAKINVRTASNEDRRDLVTHCISDFNYLDNVVALQRFGYTSWKDVEDWAKMVKETTDINYLVLDHAGFMTEKMTDAEENQTLAKNIKRLTNTLGIHILVVVQAPKTKDGLSIQTAYGGLSWAMNADNFLILERSKDNDIELRVRLEAARYPGSNPSSTPVLLFYDRESCSLSE